MDESPVADVVGFGARALRAIAHARAALDELEARLVVSAREDCRSWHSIGRDLGLSASTVYRRHVAHDPLRAHFDRLRRERAEIWGPPPP